MPSSVRHNDGTKYPFTDDGHRCPIRHGNVVSPRSKIRSQWHKTRFSPSQSLVRRCSRIGAYSGNMQRLTESAFQRRLQCPPRRQSLQQLGDGPRLWRYPSHIVRPHPHNPSLSSADEPMQLRQRLRHPANRTRPQRPPHAQPHHQCQRTRSCQER